MVFFSFSENDFVQSPKFDTKLRILLEKEEQNSNDQTFLLKSLLRKFSFNCPQNTERFVKELQQQISDLLMKNIVGSDGIED